MVQFRDGEIGLGSYLLERLAQIGIRPIFGVPGDFNLTFLDLVEDHPTLEWVGCANELNASYAADGYARVKQDQLNQVDPIASDETAKHQGGVKGVAALVTTFGVGELSALNGVAGAYAERVPIIHIVGAPSTKLQSEKAVLHHTLADGRFNAYQIASKPFSAAQAFLTSTHDATDEIDRVLRTAITSAHPTYLTLPTDLVFAPVPSAPLKTPLVPQSAPVAQPKLLPSGSHVSDEQRKMLEFVTREIVRLWTAAQAPVILVDACAIRYGVQHLVQDLVAATNAVYFSTPMGKGALPERVENGFSGVFAGDVSNDEVKAAFLSSDLVLSVGALKSDFNTGEFSAARPREQTIELHSDCTNVQYARYDGVSFHSVLPALIKTLKRRETRSAPHQAGLTHRVPDSPADEMVTQEAFWPLWGPFFRENDIVVAETGTSSFGIIDVPLPSGATMVSQVLYGSIGYATGSTLGCLKAAQEAKTPRRTILFTGDGSMQLTVQEVATMLRQGLKPILVLLNNDGYVIERCIHGENRVYNDISSWKWQELLSFFNAANVPSRSWLARTRGELESVINDAEFAAADRIQLLEVMMDRHDAPRALQVQAKLSAQVNAG